MPILRSAGHSAPAAASHGGGLFASASSIRALSWLSAVAPPPFSRIGPGDGLPGQAQLGFIQGGHRLLTGSIRAQLPGQH